MTKLDLSRVGRDDPLLTNSAELERLLAFMRAWWSGRSLTAISDAYGLTRQRVHAILSRVGCTRRLWRLARRNAADSTREAAGEIAAEARSLLLAPASIHLTPRQRCALGWQAMALVSVDIARRMATSPQNVRRLLAVARWRMERLAAKAESQEPVELQLLDERDLFRAVEEPAAMPEPAKTAEPTPMATETAAQSVAELVTFDDEPQSKPSRGRKKRQRASCRKYYRQSLNRTNPKRHQKNPIRHG